MIYTDVGLDAVQEHLEWLGAGRATSVTAMDGGLANTNYRIERVGAGALVLKICDALSVDRARMVAELCALLAARGVPTPAPLAGPAGALVREVDGRAWMVQPFVQGEWPARTPESLESVGEALAQLHAVPPLAGLPVGLPMGFTLWDALLKRAAAADRRLGQAEREMVARFRAARASLGALLGAAELPRGIVHGDLFPDNTLVKGGRVTALLDFEDASVDALAVDVAMTFTGFGWVDGRPVRALWEALLAGYERYRPLTDGERALLPALHRYATLAICAWRFDHFILQRPDLGGRDRWTEMAARLDQLSDGGPDFR